MTKVATSVETVESAPLDKNNINIIIFKKKVLKSCSIGKKSFCIENKKKQKKYNSKNRLCHYNIFMQNYVVCFI